MFKRKEAPKQAPKVTFINTLKGEERENRTLADMYVGEVVWIVPWAIRDKQIPLHYEYKPEDRIGPHGNATLKVTRTQEGYELDFRHVDETSQRKIFGW